MMACSFREHFKIETAQKSACLISTIFHIKGWLQVVPTISVEHC